MTTLDIEGCPVTAADFAACGWQKTLANLEIRGYKSMADAFAQAARRAISEQRPEHAAVLLNLLADVCSLEIPNHIDEPLRAEFPACGRPCKTSKDFSPDAIALLDAVRTDIDEARLKARVAEMLALAKPKQKISYLFEAIDAYRSIPPSARDWFHDGCACWKRALHLARTFRKIADRLPAMETALVNALLDASIQEKGFALSLAEILEKYELGKTALEIPHHLEELARKFEEVRNFELARDALHMAARWHGFQRNQTRAMETTAAVAEACTRFGEACLQVPTDSMIAWRYFKQALQFYQKIPREKRPEFGAEERIARLCKRLRESGCGIIGNMKCIIVEMDVSPIVEEARSAVRGRPAIEALLALCNLFPWMSVEKTRREVQASIRMLASTMVVSRDGRVVDNRPAAVGVIEDEMRLRHNIHVHVAAAGIAAALDVVRREHRFSESDFVRLAAESPAVPSGRERLFGKMLHLGFEGEVIVALHLIVAQVEHFVRCQLREAGVCTTVLDDKGRGIETEKGLSSLMELPEADKCLGADLAFEIRGLFCDPAGPNLRNAVAHGLLGDDEFDPDHARYAWWLVLKLVCNSLANASHEHETPGDPPLCR